MLIEEIRYQTDILGRRDDELLGYDLTQSTNDIGTATHEC